MPIATRLEEEELKRKKISKIKSMILNKSSFELTYAYNFLLSRT